MADRVEATKDQWITIPNGAVDQWIPVPAPGSPTKESNAIAADRASREVPVKAGTSFLGSMLPAVGGALGAAASGGLGGEIAGGVAGSVAQQMLQSKFPEYFGTGPTGPGDLALKAGTDALVNSAGNAVFAPVSKALTSADYMKTKLAKLFMDKEIPIEAAQMLQDYPELNPTVGQTGGGSVARVLENTVRRKSKEQILDNQHKVLSKIWADEISKLSPTGNSNPAELATIIKDGLTSGESSWQAIHNKLYDHVKDVASQYTQTINGHKVVAPVTLDTAASTAEATLDSLKAKYNKPDTAGLFEFFSSSPGTKELINNLQRLADSKGKPIDMEVAVDIKKALAAQGNFGEVFGSATEGMYKRLNGEVNEGIKSSLAGKPDLLNAYANADAQYQKYANIFKEHPEIQKVINTKLSGIADVRTVMNDPETIRVAIRGSQNPEATRKAMATDFITGLMEKGYDKETKKFSAAGVLADFTSRENVAKLKELLPGGEDKQVLNLLKGFTHLDPKLPLLGVTALGMGETRAGIQLGALAVKGLMGGSLAAGAAVNPALTLGVLVGTKSFVKGVLQDPKIAMYASQLAKLPPSSPAAQKLSKLLFLGMKGAQVEIIDPNGVVLGPATISKTGKVEPNSALQP